MFRTEKITEGMITIKKHYCHEKFNGADVFVGGWRVGQYKTEKGAMKRFNAEVAKESR